MQTSAIARGRCDADKKNVAHDTTRASISGKRIPNQFPHVKSQIFDDENCNPKPQIPNPNANL